MFCCTHVNNIKIVECILYLICCSVSAFFLWGVFEKYLSGKTSFSVYRQPIKTFPTVTLCFSKTDLTKTSYEYGSDLMIEYFLWTEDNVKSTILIEGENSPVLEKIVYLDKLITAYMGNCYKVKVKSEGLIQNKFQEFMIHFNRSIQYKDLPALKIFFTSENNVYGVSFNEPKNGHMTQLDIDKGVYKKFDLSEEKTIYHPGSNFCGKDTFYECFSKILATKINDPLPKCSPGQYFLQLP